MTTITPKHIALTAVLTMLLTSVGLYGFVFEGKSQSDINKLYICDASKVMTDTPLNTSCTSSWIKLTDYINKTTPKGITQNCVHSGCITQ